MLLEIGQPLAQGAAVVSFLDRADDAGDLAPDQIAPLTIRRELLLTLGVGAVHLFLKGSYELTHQLRRQKFFLEAAEDTRLDLLPSNGRDVVAGTFAAMGGTAITVLRHDGEAASAAATLQQAGEQEFATVNQIEGVASVIAADLEGKLMLTALRQFPETIVDDAELGDTDDLPTILRIWSCHTFSALRVFDIGAAVPFNPPDVEAVVQNAGSAVRLTSDRCVAPRASLGARNAFGIERLSDSLGR
ncbi:MAG: hypothetical protein R3D30_13980 [Hyphomicrobiales bacterium]